jgi:hypothetical protein
MKIKVSWLQGKQNLYIIIVLITGIKQICFHAVIKYTIKMIALFR